MKKIILLLLFCIGRILAFPQADPTAGGTKTPITKSIEDFGAIANDNIDDSKAFYDAANWFNDTSGHINYSNNYGVLNLGAGEYIVGEQITNNSLNSTVNYHDQPKYQPLFDNLNGLVIQGAGTDASGNYLTKIKTKPGSYFGYFQRSSATGAHIPSTGGDPNSNPQFSSINPNACGSFNGVTFLIGWGAQNVIIQNLELNGSSDTYVMGAHWSTENVGDYNLISIGIYAAAMSLSLKNLYIHNFGEDGITLETGSQAQPAGMWHATMDNVTSSWNGRQALSWVGGRNVKIENSTFAYTRLREGNPDTAANPLMSLAAGSPGANIDIEPNSINPVRNGLFNNCKIIGPGGPTTSLAIQNDSDSLTFNQCEIKGFSNADKTKGSGFMAVAIASFNRHYSFSQCNFEGVLNTRWRPDGNIIDNTGLTKFFQCSIKGNNVIGPQGAYRYFALLQTSDRVLFDSCVIMQIDERPIFEGANVGSDFNANLNPDNYTTFNNCTIVSTFDKNSQWSGFDVPGRLYGMRFTGNTIWTHSLLTPIQESMHLFVQEITINGNVSNSPNSFTFSNFDAFLGTGSCSCADTSLDLHWRDRPIIMGESPCENLYIYIGEGTTENDQTVFANQQRPLYIGEGTTLEVRKGSALVLSGNVYLAGKIIIDSGAYITYNGMMIDANGNVPSYFDSLHGPKIYYLNSTDISDHIFGLGSLQPQQPPFISTWPNADPIWIPTATRSSLMAPDEYLKTEIKNIKSSFDNPANTCLGHLLSTVDPNLTKDVDIFPNPTTDLLIIRIRNNHGISNLQLLDINGKLLYKTTIKNESELSLKQYPAGTYLIRISNATNAFVKKVVKIN